jgi:hypothetical protein
MTALVGRNGKRTLRCGTGPVVAIALPQPHDAQRQQAADLAPAFGGGEAVGMEGV